MKKPIKITQKKYQLEIDITDVEDLFLLYMSPRKFFYDLNKRIDVQDSVLNPSDFFKNIFFDKNEEEHFEQYQKNDIYREITHWDRFVFRGQADCMWELETSLYREYHRTLPPENDKSLFDREKMLLREFVRQYSRFGSNQLFDDKEYYEWFTLMQHYGVPTRFLDFTYSFYVALYFASQNVNIKDEYDTTHFSIYAVNYRWLEKRFNEIAPKRIVDLFKEKDNLGKNKEIQEQIINSKDDRFMAVRNANCFNYNSRLVHQRGTFLIPTDLDENFMSNLYATLTDGDNIYNDKVIKINVFLLDKHLVYLYKQLRHMGVSAENLFEDSLFSLGDTMKRKLLESKYTDVLVLPKLGVLR